MKRGGRTPQPTAVKRARGNPGKRAINRKEPKPLAGLPGCPAYLLDGDPAAGEVWDRLGSRFLRLGIMTESDGEALADVVESELVNARVTRAMRGTEPVEQNARGESKKNPLWTLKLEYLRERRAQHEKFGMTPSSRAKLQVSEPGPVDPLTAAMQAPAVLPADPPGNAEDEWPTSH